MASNDAWNAEIYAHHLEAVKASAESTEAYFIQLLEEAGIEIKQDNRGKYVYASYGYVIPLTDEEHEFYSQFGIPLDKSCRVGFKFYISGVEFSQEYGEPSWGMNTSRGWDWGRARYVGSSCGDVGYWHVGLFDWLGKLFGGSSPKEPPATVTYNHQIIVKIQYDTRNGSQCDRAYYIYTSNPTDTSTTPIYGTKFDLGATAFTFKDSAGISTVTLVIELTHKLVNGVWLPK
jgi:hypothetical protein